MNTLKLQVGDRATIKYAKAHIGHECQVIQLERNPRTKEVWDYRSRSHIKVSATTLTYIVLCECGKTLRHCSSHLIPLEVENVGSMMKEEFLVKLQLLEIDISKVRQEIRQNNIDQQGSADRLAGVAQRARQLSELAQQGAVSDL